MCMSSKVIRPSCILAFTMRELEHHRSKEVLLQLYTSWRDQTWSTVGRFNPLIQEMMYLPLGVHFQRWCIFHMRIDWEDWDGIMYSLEEFEISLKLVRFLKGSTIQMCGECFPLTEESRTSGHCLRISRLRRTEKCIHWEYIDSAKGPQSLCSLKMLKG